MIYRVYSVTTAGVAHAVRLLGKRGYTAEIVDEAELTISSDDELPAGVAMFTFAPLPEG